MRYEVHFIDGVSYTAQGWRIYEDTFGDFIETEEAHLLAELERVRFLDPEVEHYMQEHPEGFYIRVKKNDFPVIRIDISPEQKEADE